MNKKNQDMALLTELSVACITIDEQYVVTKCNDLALKFAKVAQKSELIGKSLPEHMWSYPLLVTIYSLARKMKNVKKSVSDYYEHNKEVYFIIGQYRNEKDLFFIIQDRTKEHQYEKWLLDRQQLESVSHLAAGVAHELRNPMAVIQGFIQLASMTGDLSKYYDTIMSEINRMNHLIEEFLSISRKKITKERVNPESLLASVLKLIRSECLMHDVNLDYQCDQLDGYIYVNEGSIKQVLLNLLRNAIEAYEGLDKERFFRLHAFQEDRFFVIRVEDFGIGMSEQVKEKLGKPFFTTKERGTGIGIPLSQKIIKDHQGCFFIESEPNIGTKVTIKLPLQAV